MIDEERSATTDVEDWGAKRYPMSNPRPPDVNGCTPRLTRERLICQYGSDEQDDRIQVDEAEMTECGDAIHVV
jgi:hypothetical protein